MSDRRYQNYNYIDGNTVRKLQPEYEPRRVPQPEKTPTKNPTREERIRRNREKNHVIDLQYALLICAACGMIFFSCFQYLKTQAQITSQKSEIASMQSELNQLTNENVAKEEVLNSSVDLKKIYKTASEKLGMKYADAEHTILYESSNPDYVKQYQDIPTN